MGLEIIVDENNQKDKSADVNQDPSDISELENEVQDISNQQNDDKGQPSGDEGQDSDQVGNEGEDEESLLPEQFKGKSRADIAKSYSELQKLLGRQSTELGELRKLAENYIKNPEKTDSKPQEDEEDIWDNPDEYINKRVESKVKSVEEKLSEFEQKQARKELLNKHSDAEQVVGSPEFQNWVSSDPVKADKFRQANDGFDIQSADELLTEWKQMQEQAKATQQKKRDKDLKAAATETSSTGQSSKKVYRRADLQRLRMTDPDRFEALQPEIIKAYAEGRVR